MQDTIAEEQFPVRLKSHQERNYSPHPCGSPFGPAELFKIVPINFSGHPQDESSISANALNTPTPPNLAMNFLQLSESGS